jgi:hypothetical protein
MQEQIPRLPVKEEGELSAPIFGTSTGKNQSEILQTLTEANVDHSNTPYELKRKRKRRGKTI